jgi:Uri superfamily endonuclease
VSPERTDSGVYLLVLRMPRRLSAKVGGLGRITLAAGSYGYVGSARRGLRARLRRHQRRTKPMHWHIDRLTRIADPVGAVIWPWRPERECRLAGALQATGLGRLAVRRFGASDCRCPGHLLRLPDVDLGRLAESVISLLGTDTSPLLLFPAGEPAPQPEEAVRSQSKP